MLGKGLSQTASAHRLSLIFTTERASAATFASLICFGIRAQTSASNFVRRHVRELDSAMSMMSIRLSVSSPLVSIPELAAILPIITAGSETNSKRSAKTGSSSNVIRFIFHPTESIWSSQFDSIVRPGSRRVHLDVLTFSGCRVDTG